MTFAQLKTLLGVGVQRADLAAFYGSFINKAIRDIEDDRSWGAMKNTADVTILSGAKTANLPDTFKELQNQQGAVCLVLDDGLTLKPVEVVTEEQDIRRLWTLGGNMSPAFRVYVDTPPDASPIIGVVAPADGDLAFRVKFYGYLPDLVADSDTNWFSENVWEMILARAKYNAFSLVNDAQAGAALAEYDSRLKEQSKSESHSQVKGRVLRMGG